MGLKPGCWQPKIGQGAFLWGAFCFVLAILYPVRPAAAQDAHRVTACFEHWPPFQVSRQAGATGISIELTRLIFAKMGKAVTFQELPYRRCVEQVRRGRLDMVVSSGGEAGLITTKNHKVAWTLGFIVPEGSDIAAARPLSVFDGKRVGIVQQFDYPAVVDQQTGWIVQVTNSDHNNLAKLSRGRLDAVLTDVPWALSLHEWKQSGFRFVEPALAIVPQPDAFRPGLEALRDRYEAELQALIDSGVLDGFYQEAIGIPFHELQGGR